MYCGFLSGLSAGLLAVFVGYPFDTIKVYQQLDTINHRTAWLATKKILKTQGIKGFFRGMSLPLFGSGAVNAMFFGSYDVTANLTDYYLYGTKHEEVLPPRTVLHSNTAILIASMVAGASQIIVGSPVELVKIKLQAGNMRHKIDKMKPIGPIKLGQILISKYGICSLYHGGFVMMLREVPSSVAYMFAYKHLSVALTHPKNPHIISFLEPWRKYEGFYSPFLAGGIAGSIATLLAVPFDIVKSRMQASSYEKMSKINLKNQFVTLYRNYGLSVFTRGIGPMCIRAFPLNGFAFVAYEWFKILCTK